MHLIDPDLGQPLRQLASPSVKLFSHSLSTLPINQQPSNIKLPSVAFHCIRSTALDYVPHPNSDITRCGPMPNVIIALPKIGGALC